MTVKNTSNTTPFPINVQVTTEHIPGIIKYLNTVSRMLEGKGRKPDIKLTKALEARGVIRPLADRLKGKCITTNVYKALNVLQKSEDKTLATNAKKIITLSTKINKQVNKKEVEVSK